MSQSSETGDASEQRWLQALLGAGQPPHSGSFGAILEGSAIASGAVTQRCVLSVLEKPALTVQEPEAGPTRAYPPTVKPWHLFTGDNTVPRGCQSDKRKQTLFQKPFNASCIFGCLLLPHPFLSPLDCHLWHIAPAPASSSLPPTA